MSAVLANLTRKWIPMVGGSCDVRMGADALERASKVLAGAVGKPRRCLAVVDDTTADEHIERLRRQIVDAGFEVVWHQAQSGAASLAAAQGLATTLADEGLTCDDLCCVLGDAALLSMASQVCGAWCGGMSMVAIPIDEVALLEGALAPRPLSVAGRARMLAVRPAVKHILLDYDLALSDAAAESACHARVLMVSAAMAASEREFSALWDNADACAAGEEDVCVAQLMAAAKSRGQLMASSAAAVRQGIEYGQDVAHALASLVGDTQPWSVLLAEGLRFSARLAVLLEKLSVDDMLAQDELLDIMGIAQMSAGIEARELVRALKQERFARSNRFMLPVPLALGRVRLTTVEDDMLLELAEAWSAAHA